MAKRTKGSIRRSQLITTYGVGAIVPFENESFMVAGLDEWPVKARPNLFEPRLMRRLHVGGFHLPPADGKGADVPMVRFPIYHYCPSCKRLDSYRFFSRMDPPTCQRCNVPLVPSRFVAACERGHIEDFPYYQWVHAGRPHRDGKHALKIEAGGVSASLSDIRIVCSCGYDRSMDGAFARFALRGVKKCAGKRPWLGDEIECDCGLRTLQRGASNVYFAVTQSSLSIPPWSDAVFKKLDPSWDSLRFVPDSALEQVLGGMFPETDGNASMEELIGAVQLRRQAEQTASTTTASDGLSRDFRREEYDALSIGKAESRQGGDFVCVAATNVRTETKEWFSQVMLVKRLREVRALTAFTRLYQPGDPDVEVALAQLSLGEVNWLPGVEVIGEGVFLVLEAARLRKWEQRKDVIERVAGVAAKYQDSFVSSGRESGRKVTPRLMLIHSLAHILIDQWSLASGYPAASLRERLYVDDEMHGLLIYTATGDSAGSLGGVVAQADRGRLWPALVEAVKRAAWCSADPLCIEIEAAGVDSLNLAACHACMLLPETSCEESNILLDRALLVGTPEKPDIGFLFEITE